MRVASDVEPCRYMEDACVADNCLPFARCAPAWLVGVRPGHQAPPYSPGSTICFAVDKVAVGPYACGH
jgi:hypothetical protein